METALSGNQMHVFVQKIIMRLLQLLQLLLLCAQLAHLEAQEMDTQTVLHAVSMAK